VKILTTLILVFALIDPTLLSGKWKIESFPAYDFLLASSLEKGVESDQYLKMLEIYNLYMDSSYYEFSNDTIYFTDMQGGKIVPKKGKWYLNHDTLVINDLEKIATYRFLVVKLDKEEFQFKSFLRNDMVAKSAKTLKRVADNK